MGVPLKKELAFLLSVHASPPKGKLTHQDRWVKARRRRYRCSERTEGIHVARGLKSEHLPQASSEAVTATPTGPHPSCWGPHPSCWGPKFIFCKVAPVEEACPGQLFSPVCALAPVIKRALACDGGSKLSKIEVKSSFHTSKTRFSKEKHAEKESRGT